MRKIWLGLGLIFVVLIIVYIYKTTITNSKITSTKTINNIDKNTEFKNVKNGDLIFQISKSRQSKAIQKATKSNYSHCGLLFKKGDRYVVYEAVQPVKKTPLDEWIAKGENGHFVIKRLKNEKLLLTSTNINKIERECEKFIGKSYDLTFEWSDDRIYCSELIWKAYQRAIGIEIGHLQKLKSFDLSDKTVKAKMKERYRNRIPYDEPVISPAAIFESNLLKVIQLSPHD